ncbi:MAG: Smr/MutS family protein [Clostridia bacterium]|nr:Smr/MutS family protein [Clostridia bacterium]
MDEPFTKLDIHGLTQEEAIRAIDEELDFAGPGTYQIRVIHGYNRGTNLRSMIHSWYRYEPRVKRIVPGENPGITVLVLRELYS